MEQGLTLSAEGDLLLVGRGEAVIDRVRVADMEEVLVFGNVSLTPGAVRSLLRRRIDTVFLTLRGQYLGRLAAPASRNAELRIAQIEKLRDPEIALSLARTVVWGKISNQRNLLLRAQRELRRDDLARAIAGMRGLLGETGTAGTLDTLRGLEGQAAALYFRSLGQCLRNPDFVFERRTRRPPRDPVNAVLSFGYTLLSMRLESLVLRAGLDPLVGFFHGAEHGRPSLALDLVEEFRTVVVDSLMLRLVNRRELGPEDFESAGVSEEPIEGEGGEEAGPGPGVWLADTGRRIFFRAWSRRLQETLYYPGRRQVLPLEDILLQQVYQVARILRGEQDDYAPFVPR
jgi:CRISPR-associated protein Cas1